MPEQGAYAGLYKPSPPSGTYPGIIPAAQWVLEAAAERTGVLYEMRTHVASLRGSG
jgi:hypothetical protein